MAIWLDAFCLGYVKFVAQESSPANPVTVAYSWAQLVATLTDRALWLFFLGVILWIAWWIDRRKDRQLEEYRAWERNNAERLSKLIGDNAECMKDLTKEMEELKTFIDRIDRRFDR